MATKSEVKIEAPSGVLTYDHVVALESRWSPSQQVTVDLSIAQDVETAAMARLIVSRKQGLRCGGDVLLTGLHGRAAARWKLNRLENVLPLAQANAEQARQSPLSTPLIGLRSAEQRCAHRGRTWTTNLGKLAQPGARRPPVTYPEYRERLAHTIRRILRQRISMKTTMVIVFAALICGVAAKLDAATILLDNFDNWNSATWRIPTWNPSGDTYLGRTQLRVSQQSWRPECNGVLTLRLDT